MYWSKEGWEIVLKSSVEGTNMRKTKEKREAEKNMEIERIENPFPCNPIPFALHLSRHDDEKYERKNDCLEGDPVKMAKEKKKKMEVLEMERGSGREKETVTSEQMKRDER